jgi:2,5-furandicarboxylate decarboxylase 1
MGGLHMNPHVRIKAIMHRQDATYYALQMPWENIWMSAPIYEAAARRALFEAGVQTVAINVTPGGCCHWHIIASIKKQPGDGKNAIMALLSIADIKHVTVVDADIDVFDPVDVEWAIATRVQADRDVIIVSNARSKPLDPSLPPPLHGKIPTTAKMGIDATIPENIPAERYTRIVYYHQGKVKLSDYVGPAAEVDGVSRHVSLTTATKRRPKTGESVEALSEKIETALGKSHYFFADLLEMFPKADYKTVASAVSRLYEGGKINQDKDGKLELRESG